MDDLLVELEKHVAALVASSTQALPSQLDISVGEDVARLRRDPSIQAALKSCDDAVDKLARMQLLLEQAAAEISSQAAATRSALAPIISLPPEILSEIFGFVVHPSTREPVHVLRMASVCREWRYTALSTNNLWSSCTTSWLDAQQAVWIARSSPGPIDVNTIWYKSSTPPLCPELRHQAFRWRSVTLCCNREALLDYLDMVMELPDLRNLQTIDLNVLYRRPNNLECDARDFLSTLPRLKSVDIEYINMFNLHTVAENLTSLYLHGVEYPFMEWWNLMSSCQNLETLRLISCESSKPEPHSTLETIVFSRLRDLWIEDYEYYPGHIILDHISAPMLHTFQIEHHCESSGSCMSIQLFLQRHHNISTLAIGTPGARIAFDWLKTLPDVSIDDTLAPGHKQPLPNLKHLKLQSGSISPEDIKELIGNRERYIMSKRPGTSPKVFASLRTPYIKYTEEIENWIKERVEKFEKS